MKAIIIICSVAFSGPALAEEEIEEIELGEIEEVTSESTWYTDAYPAYERGLNTLTARTFPEGTFGAIIAHRTNQTFTEEPFHDALGFDGGGLQIGLGLRYGVAAGFDIGVYRLNGVSFAWDTYEIDARLQVLRDKDHGVDVALRAGVSWYSQTDEVAEEDASGFFGQLLFTKVVANRALLSGTISYHTDSSNEAKTSFDDDGTLGAGAIVELRVTDWIALDAEVTAGLSGYKADNITYSAGPKVITNRHTFAVVISNTQLMGVDGLYTNTMREFGDPILGFNITRQL